MSFTLSMKRVLLPLFVVCTSFLMTSAVAQERQWFHVVTYHLNSEKSEALFDKTFAEAVLPGLKKQGLGPIGVFKPIKFAKKQDELARQRCVVYPLSSPEQIVSLSENLGSDDAFLQSAADYLGIEKDAAVFSRVESTLLYAFEGMPQLAVPANPSDQARVFELRVYESYSEMKGKRKVQMFNEGEIDIFNNVGLDAVFYGEAIVGKNLPQLTYMLVYNDEAHHAEVWKKFLTSPAWDKLKKLEQYKDTVSKIENTFMQALPYSGIK